MPADALWSPAAVMDSVVGSEDVTVAAVPVLLKGPSVVAEAAAAAAAAA